MSKDERIQISALYNQNHNIANISKYLKRPECTISREISRNKSDNKTYNYSIAHKLAKQRRINLNKERTNSTKSKPDSYNLKSDSNNWIKYLKILGKKGNYRRKYGTKIRELEREKLNKKNISLRPQIVEQRSRLGDFEGDTIVGLEKNIHILTHVDRKSGYLIARLLKTATAEETRDQTLISFESIPKSKLRTITYDNGVQFSKHQDTEQKLNTEIYFANPYHSWERSTNENTNGLLRYYYPKKTPFKDLTQKQLDKTVEQINDRPKKRLNYLTPKEVFIKNWKKIRLAL